jgi:hypothetical protein
VRRIALAALLAAAAFAAVSWLALEGAEVAVLRTRAPDGGFEATRVWIAEEDGAAWVEAATAERSWYQSLRMHPEVEVVRAGGEVRRYRAVPEPGPEGHAHVRLLLRAKYGWADRWVGLLQDTSQSVAVRLEPTS